MQTVYHIAPTFVNRFTKVLHIALSHLMVALQTALKFYNVARVPLRLNMQFSDFRGKLVDSIEESFAVLRQGWHQRVDDSAQMVRLKRGTRCPMTPATMMRT